MSILDRIVDRIDAKDIDGLKQHEWRITILANEARENLANYEEELKAIAAKIKIGTEAVVETVQDKVEEVVEVVKEEVKKATPKKSTKKE